MIPATRSPFTQRSNPRDTGKHRQAMGMRRPASEARVAAEGLPWETRVWAWRFSAHYSCLMFGTIRYPAGNIPADWPESRSELIPPHGPMFDLFDSRP